MSWHIVLSSNENGGRRGNDDMCLWCCLLPLSRGHLPRTWSYIHTYIAQEEQQHQQVFIQAPYAREHQGLLEVI
jgi:hypothetical protein